VPAKRARLYDVIALLTAVVVVVLDQWTKNLVVKNIPLGSEVPLPVVGHFLVLEYIQNSGAAFSMFRGNIILAVLIAAAILVVAYLYARMLNSGPLIYKIVFGMIIGGALGNLLDRFTRGGSVVDFVSFRIPEINYRFAIFNIADACISVGVFLLFILVLFGGFGRSTAEAKNNDAESGAALRSSEQDAQS